MPNVNTKRIVALEVGSQTVKVVMHRHHWARQFSLSLRPDGTVRLSVPPRTPWVLAEQFLNRSRKWLEENLPVASRVQRRTPTVQERKAARQLVELKLEQWRPHMKRGWGTVRIGDQSSRWGSCSTTGTLSFNWRLIELPSQLSDYIVVHELVHLEHQHHGPDFWQRMGELLPDWKDRRRRLKSFALHD